MGRELENLVQMQLKTGRQRNENVGTPFSDSSSNLTIIMDEGARLSSDSVKSRTFGSETFRSRFGGDWSRQCHIRRERVSCSQAGHTQYELDRPDLLS